MITSVKSDFSVMPRCNGDEIGLFEILDKLILSTGSDSGGGDGNHQQCLAVYHHREVKCRISLWSVINRRLLCRNNPVM